VLEGFFRRILRVGARKEIVFPLAVGVMRATFLPSVRNRFAVSAWWLYGRRPPAISRS
jgi:hypothetical protein